MKTICRKFNILLLRWKRHMSTANDVLSAALSLDSEQRAAVAHKLLLSLEPDDFDSDTEHAWAEEIRRRLADFRAGRTQLVDWDDALADMRQALREKDNA